MGNITRVLHGEWNAGILPLPVVAPDIGAFSTEDGKPLEYVPSVLSITETDASGGPCTDVYVLSAETRAVLAIGLIHGKAPGGPGGDLAVEPLSDAQKDAIRQALGSGLVIAHTTPKPPPQMAPSLRGRRGR